MLKRRCGAAVALVSMAVTAGVHAQVAGPSASAPTALTFDQALEYALDHYPAIKAALEQVQASSASVSVARAAVLPRFDSLWQVNHGTANNIFGLLLPQSVIPPISGPELSSSVSQSVWSQAVGGLFSWEPVDLGLRTATIREAEAGVARAQADEAVTRLTVQNAVGVAFLTVARAEQASVAAQADVERREVLARAAHTLADNQLRPGAEASRADAELAAARTRAVQAREAVALAHATLTRTLGLSAGQVRVDATRLMDLVGPAATVPSTSAPHPLVQSEQAAVDLARAREDVLAATDRPRLYLQSSVSARGSGAAPDAPFDGGLSGLSFERANWAAGVQVVFPNPFDFSSLRARRAEASALTRAEQARHEEAVLTVTSQQRAADAMVDAARAIAENTPVQLAAARQSETQARARYEAGLASIVEVAEAQNLLAGAEYQDASARVDLWRALLAQAVAQGSLTPLIELVRGPGRP